MTPDRYNTTQLAAGNIDAADITALVRRYQRTVALKPDGYCGPQTQAALDGWSSLATRSRRPWGGRPRSVRWRGRVYCLTVHTTGVTIVERALKQGRDPLLLAVRYYQRSTGTHYVLGWQGEIIQVASEHQRAHGVGTGDQRRIERSPNGWAMALVDYLVREKGWSRERAEDLLRRWRERWAHPGVEKPSDLYPGNNYNDLAVHVEMPPLPPELRDQAAAPGLWYTRAQLEALARLAVDWARRNGVAGDPEWWRRRLLAHEDVTPLNRPGWGPGWLRAEPRFDWALVYATIERLAP